ncbi:hypothetical protein B9Z55_000574 [Caenorhabditis nigoni]|uniref:Uncharacterized protein n=1 Tax=Caenorhabditis nigoni TaxID=1611254 RepID=A0A2G5VTU9_9PELO|nr:hypothetical protein B9Z55_000574 [Caenorhabditis nigoni]
MYVGFAFGLSGRAKCRNWPKSTVYDSTPELKKLDCIESLLIQKARVVQTIVNLKDIGGRTTATTTTAQWC